ARGGARRHRDPRLLRLGPGDPGAARALPGGPRHRDRGRRARAGVPPAHGGGAAGGGVRRFVYIRCELLRTIRNRRYALAALGFPIVLYFLIAGPNKGEHDLGGSGLSAPLYYMVGLASFGAMNAMLSVAGRIATERTAGWNRQLRLTPLTARDYFRIKILTGYLTVLAALALLFLAGTTLGVRLGARDWLVMTGLILVGLVPFGALAV